jgi:hypothetical protein
MNIETLIRRLESPDELNRVETVEVMKLAALQLARACEALEQAQQCIHGDTPEDCSVEIARADTLQKIRRVLLS